MSNSNLQSLLSDATRGALFNAFQQPRIIHLQDSIIDLTAAELRQLLRETLSEGLSGKKSETNKMVYSHKEAQAEQLVVEFLANLAAPGAVSSEDKAAIWVFSQQILLEEWAKLHLSSANESDYAAPQQATSDTKSIRDLISAFEQALHKLDCLESLGDQLSCLPFGAAATSDGEAFPVRRKLLSEIYEAMRNTFVQPVGTRSQVEALIEEVKSAL